MIFIGSMIYGYAGGYFGRDSYEDKRVEAFGVDWIVARDERGRVHFATFPDNETMLKRFMEYSIKPEDS